MTKLVAQTMIILIFCLLVGNQASSTPIEHYKVFSVNDLGMHCVDDDYSIFTILPLFNVVQAQVIGIDNEGRPRLLTPSDGIELTYAATKDATGSINSSWKDINGVAKTNFWDYEQAYGLNLPNSKGIFGLTMPKDAKKRADKSFTWVNKEGVFKAEGVPITPIDDNGNKNPYPMLKVQLRKTSNHHLIKGAFTRTVLPVSDETTCKNCHATGTKAANPDKRINGKRISWSANPNLSLQYRENIILLHDAKFGTAPQLQLKGKEPVLCASCHYSAALDLTGAGPNDEQKKHSTMSAAMHDNHADKMGFIGKKLPDFAVPVGGKIPAPPKQSCYQCHPGSDTRCLRGAMTEDVTCQNCHGDMKANGGFYPLKTGGSLDGKNDGGKRRPWVDLPRCQSCHTGDETDHLPVTASTSADGLRQWFAYNTGDLSASPKLASNKRFAEEENTLFRFSKGHGGLLCETCHNSTHAIWPGDKKHKNDNIAAKIAQGHSGTLIECSTCHQKDSLPRTMNGPHGMHNVNDRAWYGGDHNDFYDRDPKSCQSCHGLDLKGSPLAKVATARTFNTEFGLKTYKKGDQVTCYDCHNGVESEHEDH